MSGALASLDADIVVLTEYVPDPKYDIQFQKDLKLSGFSEVLISDHYGPENDVHNRILIASRMPMNKGAIKAPTDIIDGVPNNIFHVFIPEMGLGILGLRMPLPMEAGKKKDWWDWVTEVAEENRNHPFIILGDFNTEPTTKGPDGGVRLLNLEENGWQHASPVTGASWWVRRDDIVYEHRLDHAFFSNHFTIRDPKYITEHGEYVFVKKPGELKPNAMSDHAVLLVDVDLKM